ncbi:MAG: RnfABCDGE type electron transport complex subunit B [Firmicutes bacterium]|nr:RnfABCDGE type electron transport complex subunit B [Bacillota bacterium]
MHTVLIAVLLITVIGIVCAAILSIASKIMYVAVDERVTKINAALPGTNCGACGFPGCAGYASALIENSETKSNLCTPGGADVVAQISAVLGIESEAVASKVAVILCGSDADTQTKKMTYTGIQSCYAAATVFCGESACAYGCLGYGDCKLVCPFDAICVTNGLARVNRNLCTGCGLCVAACPHKIISIQNGESKTHVLCSNIEKAAAVRKKCTKCCFGCGRCMRECPEKAVVVENNLAKIDYEKCTDCGHCVGICPTKCIRALV